MNFSPHFLGLGGGGGSGKLIDNPTGPRMTKEAMMEDLVKRSADSSGSSQAAIGNSGAAGPEPVWKETGGGFNLELGKLFFNITFHYINNKL